MFNLKKSTLTVVTATLMAVSAPTALLSNTAHAHDHKNGTDNGPTLTEVYDFTGFDEISITGVYNLDVEVGETYSIVLSGSEKEMNNVKVTRDGDTLELGRKKKDKKIKGKSNNGVSAIITLPALNALEIIGVGSGEINGVDSENFNLDISGVGELSISGKCGALEANIAGVGEINTKKLKCKTADISLAGVGEMTAYASETVDVSAAGIGGVKVYGGPKNVSKSKGFLSSVKIYD